VSFHHTDHRAGGLKHTLKPDAPTMHPRCTQHAPTIHSRCITNTQIVEHEPSNTIQTWMHPRCTQDAPTMHPRCTHSHRSYSRRCTQNPHHMHLGCTREASTMHNKCTHRIAGAFKTDTTLHAPRCTLDAPSMHPFPQIVEHAPPNSIHTTCALDAHHMPTTHTPRTHQIDTKSLRDPKFLKLEPMYCVASS